ncbi:hypothetical protein ACFLRW_05905 [Acidobacteriota bacterium]
MNKTTNRKICPHCDSPLDEGDISCPTCEKLYWQPESQLHREISEKETEDETMGCLPLFFWPLLISFAVTSILILLGFLVHVFSHFEANQVKVIWILCSTAAGGLVYKITIKIKKRRSKHSSN